MLSILVGVTGVGKTSILEATSELNDSPEFSHFNYGDVLLELAKEDNLVSHRDELTEIEPERYNQLQKEVPRKIASKADDSLCVLDTHATLNTPSGYRPGLPEESIQALNPDNITFIKAKPSEIQERTKSDESRERDVLSVAELREQQQVALQMASTDSVLAGCPLQIIHNNDGCLSSSTVKYKNTLLELTN